MAWELQVARDISPSGGPRLDTPARADGERYGPHRAAGRPSPAEPSLVRVAATTLRLWWRRRVLRLQDGRRVGVLRWSVLAVVVVVLAAAAIAVTVAGTGSHPAAAPPKKPRPAPPTAAQLQTVANEQAASSWVQAQVDPGAPLGCDPSMCGYLAEAGVSAASQVVFGHGADVPGTAAFVVSTPVLRSQSGDSLANGATEVVASFGSGRERVDVLVAASGTAAAFLQAAQQAQHASAKLGRSLARNRRLKEGPNTRHELTTGQVDRRLLVVLKQLLAAHSVSLAGFGDADPGASWSAPLRSMTIDGLVRHVGKRRVNLVGADLKLVQGLHPPYTATAQQITRARGGASLVIQVPLRAALQTGSD
jgi:hypothetical protein